MYMYKSYKCFIKNFNIFFLLNYFIMYSFYYYLFYKLYDFFNKGIWLQNLIIFLIIFFYIYWFFSVFLFLIKKNTFNRYTTVIQRFWKRSLHLFWLIEIFLFLIYLFLVSITPEENFHILDNNRVNRKYILDLYDFFQKICYMTIIISYLNFYLFFFRFSLKYYVLFLYIIFLKYLLLEFLQMYYLLNFSYNFSYKFEEKGNFWKFEWEYLKSRTQNHYIVLLVILKFWHTFYIFIFLYIYIWQTFSYTNSYNWLSTLLQNFFYIYFFNIILMYVWLKYTIKYFGVIPYYWFFSNINVVFSFHRYFNWYYLFSY